MAQQQSPHLSNIPQAIQIAAATDPSIDPALKQQALDYLQEVKERCEETWQVSLGGGCCIGRLWEERYARKLESRVRKHTFPLPFPSDTHAATRTSHSFLIRSELTAQDCLALYLQGAGASSVGAVGSDGKDKLDPSMRMFCEQIVDATMINK